MQYTERCYADANADVDDDLAVQPRRSQRTKELVVASPWVMLKAYRRKKRGVSPAERFFQTISQRRTIEDSEYV